MEKSKVLILFFIILVFLCCCSKEEEQIFTYTVNGTVYVESVPAPNVRVEAKYLGGETHEGHNWYNLGDMLTDSDGKYEFVLEKNESRGWRFQVRAQNPLNGVWSEWKESGSVAAGASFTVNFNFRE